MVGCMPVYMTLLNEILESIGWIALGFLPTLAAMEVARKIGSSRNNSTSNNGDNDSASNRLLAMKGMDDGGGTAE